MPRFSPLLAAAVALSLGSVAHAAALLNTPVTLTTCQPAALSWSGAQGSVYISAVVGTNTAAAPIKVFPVQRGDSGVYTWTVDVAEGITLTFIINDDTGVQNFTGQVTVREGSTDDCVTGNVSVGAAAAATGASSAPAAGAAPAPSSSAPASSSTSAAAGPGAGRTTTTGTSTFTSIGSGTSTFTGASSSSRASSSASSSAASASGTGAPANGAWSSRGAPSAAAVCAAVLAAFAL
ncbi:hypothetical protein FA09DRAFT_338234 [Tilletiopsis washingtonensis]|uniref:Uncharacterized protein n=1 Tax=Tilletiopsis washingtonensis TaxID=58919 RepID=A0A316Z989_9BASI|nr:hypothetical protein FA09DRAFT_338234 [Tilletiopsis washingtonensis]PWN98357.1 hypothetical protein FA09DRAFT_338234 [Tilletiopsis washingtonensis]